MNGIIIPKGSSEAVKHLLAQDGVQLGRSYPVPEYPPGHCDHPHHDEDHHNNVINKITAELTEAACSIITTCQFILHTVHEIGERYPD